MLKPCLFCRLELKSEHIFQNDSFYIIIDQNPVNPGHLLIIPHRHLETFFELNAHEGSQLLETILQAKALCRSPQVKKNYQDLAANAANPVTRQWCQLALDNWDRPVTGYNLGVNNGLGAGQTVMHLHIHLIPRFNGDVADPTGGVRFVIPERANYRQ